MSRPSSGITLASAFLVLLPLALAQSPLYGQCGGIGYSGPTTCVSGSVCTYGNPYYSQCLPGTASPTAQPTTTASTTFTTSTGPTTTGTSKGPNYIFSFGDSYTQTGFNANGALPNTNNPIGNPAFPGGTNTGGANWLGYLTSTYNNSLVYTYNYAYGGATIDASLVKPYSGVSMTDEVNTFLNTVASKPSSTPWTSANALFSIWIGINDLGAGYSGDRGAFSDTLLNAEFALVEKLYNVGARNFLWANIPPMDRTPQLISQGTAAQNAQASVIAGFNSRLATKISQFQASHSGVKTFLYDSNAQFTTILNNPTAYGFKDATSYGSASNQFWGNNYHPSTYANKYFGQQVGKVVLSGTVW